MEMLNKTPCKSKKNILDETQSSNVNLINQIYCKLDTQSPWSNDKYFYKLTIAKTPLRTNYHIFSFEDFKAISRKITNGVASIGRVANRYFWNKYFIGGVKVVSIIQENEQSYPTFKLKFLLYSNYDNLDVLIKAGLTSRIRKIDPLLSVSFDYLGNYDKLLITDYTNALNSIYSNSETLNKLGEINMKQILNNKTQKPYFLGDLYGK
ncbi:hypothetical protein GCM10011514_48800 [Emticicia aquatilis]|uniref:Uncharacterized protein n=1 Tax=Emticicia aquatilis TaxID=1537369 RepID=A0A916Z6Y2_9BACT|nr:hypothetical protein [Emticicia aquatilis]GGD79005.1 hypothetical protein GCM10011514_48800 [Emticicia aquatilis]